MAHRWACTNRNRACGRIWWGAASPFWKFFFPKLKGRLSPSSWPIKPLESFYRAANKVSPSFIRVEADEVTYGLHIMLRFEMENDLIEGRLKAADVPEAWNAKMQEFLGITPPTTAQGALQDIHWSSGLIGYFPTYQLGNLISLQLWDKINADIPDLADQIEHGEFGALLDMAAHQPASARAQVHVGGIVAAHHRQRPESRAVSQVSEGQVRRDLRAVGW